MEEIDITKIKIPDGYKIIPDGSIEVLKEEKIKIEKELSEEVEPSDNELIDFGRAMHPYYDKIRRLENLNGN